MWWKTDVVLENKADEDIPEEKLEKIIQAGLLAPTSRNRKPCNFMVVKDRETLNKLSKSKRTGSKMLKGANTAIVVYADSDKADTWIEDSAVLSLYESLCLGAGYRIPVGFKYI